MAAAGSVADGAIAELVLVPVTGSCSSCGGEFRSDDAVSACPSCGSFELVLTGGDELTLELLEYRA
jgi:hydrogenase nickel incorporation protein HypA/HybF